MPERPVTFVMAILSLLLYILIGYSIERHDTIELFACYFLLFIIYALWLRRGTEISTKELKFWIATALLIRVSLLFSFPSLSDDFYRFIWDGRLVAAGQSPFAEVPSFYMEPSHHIAGLDAELFEKLNSKHRFSSYPPVCQFIYWIAAEMSPDSIFGTVVIMKIILFLFEAGTLWLLASLLQTLRLPPANLLVYALNPLVIIEIVGNLHFEGVMLFFLLLAMKLLIAKKGVLSSAAFALSICTKLIPLLLLPLLVRLLGWRRAFYYWLMTAVATIIFFLPLINRELVAGFYTSLNYYFQYFEFNASIYYLIREVGFWIFGFNIIHFAGPALAIVAGALILWISFRTTVVHSLTIKHVDLFTGMIWCLLIYFLSTTTLHPWYIITLLAISLFTRYRFPILWTGLIFLTYAGYSENSFEENLFLVSLEYIALFVYIGFETIWSRPKNHS